MSISIRLDHDTEARLERLAKKTGRSKTYYIREAILDHIDDLEDIYLSLKRLEKPSKSWKQEELEKNIDLES